jgi:hypothetical protein
MNKDTLKKLGLSLAGVASSAALLGTALTVHAADYTASTTAAINSAGESILGMFFTNLPVILTFVVAIIVTLWGVRWVLSHFTRGRK